MNALIWIKQLQTLINIEGKTIYVDTNMVDIDNIIKEYNLDKVIVAQSGLSKYLSEDNLFKYSDNITLMSDLEVISKICSSKYELTGILSYGSSFSVLKEDSIKRYSGYGYLLDDIGSIYDLGKKILKTYLSYIEKEEVNEFTKKCEEVMNINEFNSEKFIYDLYNNESTYVIDIALGFKNYDGEVFNELINNYCEEIVDYMYDIVRKNNLTKINIVGELVSFKQIRIFFDDINLIEVIEDDFLTYENYFKKNENILIP